MATIAAGPHRTYTLHASVTANGQAKPHTEVTIDGALQVWQLDGTSNHEAFYLGIVGILADAIQTGLHSVTIVLGEQTALRQLVRGERRIDEGMRVLNEAVRLLETRIPGGVSYR